MVASGTVTSGVSAMRAFGTAPRPIASTDEVPIATSDGPRIAPSLSRR